MIALRALAAALLVLGLVACDGEDPVTTATREIATANQAAAAVAQVKAEAEAKEKAAPTASVTTAACDVEVSFGSFGAGVDAPLREQILALTRANPDVTASTEEPWGREGESTLCLKAKDEAAVDRLYGMIAAQLPSTSTRGPTTVRHRDGRSHAATYPPGA